MALGIQLGIGLDNSVGGTVAAVITTINGLTSGEARPGDHAGITMSVDEGTITARKWGSTSGGSEYGTGTSPTTYTAGDGGLLYATATVDGEDYTASAPIRYAAGTAPAIADGQSWTVDDTSVNIDASASGTGLTWSYALTGSTAGVTINASSGLISGTPTGVGSGTATIIGTDQYGRTVQDTFTWSSALRTAATAADGLGPFSWTVDDTSVSVTASSDFTLNGNTLTYTATGLPTGVTIASNGVISGTPTAASSGAIVITGQDEYGREVTSTTSHTTALRAQATGGADLDLSFVEDSAISATDLTANWSENGNSLTYAIVGTALPAGLSVSSAGLMTGTPPTVTADATYTLRGTDEYGRVTEDTFTLEVTVAITTPVLSALSVSAQETDGDVPLSYTLDTDTDVHFVLTTSATQPTAAQIAAGQDHTGAAAPESFTAALTTSGSPINASITSTSLDGSYYIHAVVDGGADGDVITATGSPVAIDTTAPSLSSPGSSNLAETTADGAVTSNSDQGTLYAGVWITATTPSAADIIAGTGAAYSTSDATPTAGVNSFSATGLTASTSYRWHFHQVDDNANASGVSSSAAFSTTAAVTVTDDFNRADENLTADAAWTNRIGSTTLLQVVSNEVRSLVSGGNEELDTHSDTLANDQEASIAITGTSGSGENIVGPIVRHSGAATRECYALHLQTGPSPFIRIMRGNDFNVLNSVTVAAAETQTGESFTTYPAVIKLRVVGTALTAYINDVEITGLASTDSTYTAGAAGVWVLYADGTNATTFDDFTSGDV